MLLDPTEGWRPGPPEGSLRRGREGPGVQHLLHAFAVHRVRMTTRLLLPVLGVAAYSAGVMALEEQWFHQEFLVPAGIHAVLGFLLGLCLVFRTNTAHDRWWEARKLWGQVVNDLRNLATKARALVELSAEERADFADRLVAYAGGLRDHLRGSFQLRDLPGLEGAEAQPAHGPSWLAARVWNRLAAWRAQGRLDEPGMLALDRHASPLLDVCGGCERIKNTPLPFSHRVSIRQVLVLYLLVMPWSLENSPAAFLVPALAAWFLLGLEQVAHDIEEPFGPEEDDLPLDEICAGLERSVRQALQGALD